MLRKKIVNIIASIAIIGLSTGCMLSTAQARVRHRHHYHYHHHYRHYHRHRHYRHHVRVYHHRPTIAVSAGGSIQVEPTGFRVPGFNVPVLNTRVQATRLEVPGFSVSGHYSLAFHGVNPLAIARRSLGHGRYRGMPYEWCRSFVNRVLRRGGYFTTSSNLAINALRLGPHVRDPKYGDLAVMHGHVTFFAGYDNRGYIIGLGGNQGGHRGRRLVQYSHYSPRRVIAYVHPVLASRYEAMYHAHYTRHIHYSRAYALYKHSHHWRHRHYRHRRVYYSRYPAGHYRGHARKHRA